MQRFIVILKLLPYVGLLCLGMLKRNSKARSQNLIEQRGTKVENENLKGFSDHKTESLLPLDVILEILSRLPVKPVVRCKSVCKLWHSAIQDRKFIEKHMRCNGRHLRFQEAASGVALRCYHSVDGLVLEGSKSRNKLYFSNPATGQKVKLPDLLKGAKRIRFAYIHTSNSYKLVYVHAKVGRENGGCQVLTVGTDPTWRSINIPSLHSLGSPRERSGSLIIDGIFFLSRFRVANPGVAELIYLDLASENFGNINAPPVIFKKGKKVSLAKWENKLSLVGYADEEMHFWVLEDYKKQKWSRKDIAVPSNFLEKYPHLVTPLSPLSVNNGVLHFYLQKGYYVRYHIASRKASVTAPPPGKRISSIGYYSIVRIPEINQEGSELVNIKSQLGLSPFLNIFSILLNFRRRSIC